MTPHRALTFARAIAESQVVYSRGHKAAERGERPRPPKGCPDPASWWAGWTAGRKATR